LAVRRKAALDGGAELPGQLGDGGGMSGTISQVRQFFRVGVVIVKLAALPAFIPLGVSPARGAQAVTEETIAAMSGFERPVLSGDPVRSNNTKTSGCGYDLTARKVAL
jgi:hypothetical protein